MGLVLFFCEILNTQIAGFAIREIAFKNLLPNFG